MQAQLDYEKLGKKMVEVLGGNLIQQDQVAVVTRTSMGVLLGGLIGIIVCPTVIAVVAVSEMVVIGVSVLGGGAAGFYIGSGTLGKKAKAVKLVFPRLDISNVATFYNGLSAANKQRFQKTWNTN